MWFYLIIIRISVFGFVLRNTVFYLGKSSGFILLYTFSVKNLIIYPLFAIRILSPNRTKIDPLKPTHWNAHILPLLIPKQNKATARRWNYVQEYYLYWAVSSKNPDYLAQSAQRSLMKDSPALAVLVQLWFCILTAICGQQLPWNDPRRRVRELGTELVARIR